jgi:PAS domain S-box-containing protein
MGSKTLDYDRYRELVEASPAAIILTGADGVVRYVNCEAERMFGYAREQLIGRPIELLVPARFRLRHVAFRRLYCADPSRRRMGADRLITGRRRDGAEFPVEIGLSPAQTAAGLVVAATVIDMSERREIEAALATSVDELERSHERLAQFAYVAALDLTQPLDEIAAQSALLERAMSAGDEEKVTRASREMRRCALGARRLVEDLLIYARAIYGDLRLEALDLREEVQFSLAELAGAIAEAGTRLRVETPAATFIADRAQFALLLQNVVANAIKYRKPGQPAEVTISAKVDETSMIRLEIVDRGVGFDAEFAQRIFEPFSRPKGGGAEYAGAGIELAICKSIADRHGWNISVETEPGQGAAFRFDIPALFAVPSSDEE